MNETLCQEVASNVPPPPPPPLSHELKLGLLDNVVANAADYCRVTFDESSRRHQRSRPPREEALAAEVERQLATLEDWSHEPHVAIGGVNALGKSSFDSGRFYAKVNLVEPRLTSGSAYNHEALVSFEYLMLQHCIGIRQKQQEQQWICWDRCRYENLMFYFVSYLQHEYSSRNATIPMPQPHEPPRCGDREILTVLNSLAAQCNLLETLALLERELRIPTLFLVCSDLALVGLALFRRGGKNDVYNATQWNYQAAQFHVYRYFAGILRYPCLDFAAFVAHDPSMTLSKFHEIIRARINPRDVDYRGGGSGGNGAVQVADLSKLVADIPGLSQAREFAEMFAGLSESTLVYSLSSK